MKKATITVFVIAVAIFVINSCGDNSKPPATTNQDSDKNPAMNNPDKFAW